MPETPAPETLLLATTNAHKLQEYRALLAGLPLRVLALADVGIGEDVEEGDVSFLANARLKAQTYWQLAQARGLRTWVLADDSGLEVDALGGAPGVMSTRWAGPESTAATRNILLLARLQAVPPDARGARFRCVIVLLSPDGQETIGDGTVAGRITLAPRQHPGYGFGYDPIFELPDRGLTFGELAPADKDAISHRGIAGRQIRAALLAALRRSEIP
ncbi:MAG TPA: non-canonical purine NTP pyrophosphatase [Chloroflexia bacterium]|nr:non-canonical purine NTP pyrophosphatase [Chloroflexia bacterium]